MKSIVNCFINKNGFIMRKFLLNLLFAALMVPWVTQTQAQDCDNNAYMCSITIHMVDDYGDGWNGASLEVY